MARRLSDTRFIKDANLKAYWKLEDLTDSSGNGNTLTANGSPSNVAGKFDNCYTFDGTSQWLSLASPVTTAVDNFTMMAWVYVNTTSEKGCIIKVGNYTWGADNGWSMFIGNNSDGDTAGNYLMGLAEGVAWKPFGITIGTGWHHLCVLRRSGTWYGFVDGVRGGTSQTGAPTTPTNNTLIAKCITDNSTHPRYYNNKIDEVAIFDRALSDAEVWEIAKSDLPFYKIIRGSIGAFFKNDPTLKLYNQFRVSGAQEGNGSYNDALAFWKLEDTSDSSGNSKTLTNNNTVTFAAGKFSNGGNFVRSSNQYLSIADSLGINGGIISMSCWGKIASQPGTNNYYTFLSQGAAGTDTNYEIWYGDDAGTKSLHFKRTKYGIADQGASLAITLNTGEWYHFALTYDGTNVYLYLDGVLRASGAASGNGNNGATDACTIGSWSQGAPNHCLNGMVDNAAIWNRVLSAQEIAAQAGNPIFDNSGNQNIPSSYTNLSFVKGSIGNAITFDGSASKIMMPGRAFQFGTTPFAIALWVKNSNTSNKLILYGSDGTRVVSMGLNDTTTGDIVCQIYDGSGDTPHATEVNMNDGNWHFVVFQRNGTKVQIFIDGKDRTTSSVTDNARSTPDASGTNYAIGVRNDISYGFFAGSLQEVAFFTRAFSPKEISQYYKWATNIKRSTLGSWVITAASYILALAQGSYTLTGQALGFMKAWLMSLVRGAYTLTGNVTNLLKGWLSTLAQGSYSLTGFDVIFYKGIGYVLTAAQGAYVLTGEALAFLKNLSISLAQGSYTLAGQVMFLFKNWGMAMVKGVYTLSGQAVALSKNMYLTIAEGAYTLTGQAITLIKGKVLSAITGLYTLSGKTVRAYLNGNLIGLWKKVGIATDRVWRKVSKNE